MRFSTICNRFLLNDVFFFLKGGSFKFVKKDKGKKGTKQKLTTSNSDQPTTVFEKKMSNYFSIGIDARIGLGISLRTEIVELTHQ